MLLVLVHTILLVDEGGLWLSLLDVVTAFAFLHLRLVYGHLSELRFSIKVLRLVVIIIIGRIIFWFGGISDWRVVGDHPFLWELL